MLKLLRRDFILNRRVLALTYVFWSALWLGLPAVRPHEAIPFGFWTGMVSVPCAFLPVMMLAREDKFRAGALACSLPVTRRTIVASRYVGGWLVALIAVACAAAAMAALSLAGLQSLAPPTPLLPVLVVTIIGLALAVMMPSTIRFGVGGIIGLFVVLQLAGIAVLLSAKLFGSAHGIHGIEAIVRSGTRATAWLHDTLGSVGFSAVLVVAVAALNLASYRLSVWLYSRREF